MNKKKGVWRFLSASQTPPIRLKQSFSVLVLFLLMVCIVLQLTVSQSAFAGTLICEKEEHTHSDSCYEQVLVCESTDENHKHDENCYTSSLVCELEEHQHTEDCYEEEEEISISTAALQEDGIQAQTDEPTAQADSTTTSKVVNPENTTINLFNYSTGWQDDIAMWNDWGNQWTSSGHVSTGINANKIFKFRKGGIDAVTGANSDNYDNEYLKLKTNMYAGNAQNAIQGIVSNRLINGYPVLSTTFNNGELSGYSSSSRNLEYLFSVDDQPLTGSGYGNLQNTTVNYKESYGDVKGLLQQDANGYFYYNSQDNFAQFDVNPNDGSTGTFTLYPRSVTNNEDPTKMIGQFFPFNSYSETIDEDTGSMIDCANPNLDHYFGMTLTTTFIQQFGGKTSSGANAKDMVFEFSGDDDVWVFIDGVLVGDVGGIHEACSLEINFNSGEVSVWSTYGDTTKQNVATTTIKDQFVAADVADNYNWNGNSFADDTTHTLKFFYLERGNFDSNLSIKYNLINYPNTTIEKVDQNGNAVDGAVFALYKATLGSDRDKTDVSSYNYTDSTGSVISYSQGESATVSLDESTYGYLSTSDGSITVKPVFIGTTVNGKLTFIDDDGNPLSVNDIQLLLGGETMILREIVVPSGYRSTADQVCLYFEDGYLINPDPYDNGVWPSNQALVTATNQLTLIKPTVDSTGTTVSEYTIQDYFNASSGSSEGTLFYVVLKRNDKSLNLNSIDPLSEWVPVIGNDDDGYEVGTSYDLDYIIDMAQLDVSKYGSDIVFTRSSSNSMQLLVTNLPGKISRYFTYMWEQAGSSIANFTYDDLDPQYAVAYFWTEGTLDDADSTNTYRVVSHSGIATDEDGNLSDSAFSTIWGSKLEIPDIINRLYVQKRDTEGNPVDDTVFALYKVNVDNSGDSEVYTYEATSVSDGSIVSVILDPIKTFDQLVSATNQGTASVSGTSGYTYQVETDGNIKIYNSSGLHVYTISPVKNANGVNCVVDTESSGASDTGYVGVYDRAVGYFDYLTEGTYVIREVSVPEGFSYNTAETKVIVNKYGVFANAGTSDDRVDVGNGAGYLATTMDVFASSASIDETLTWIYTLQRITSGTDFADYSNFSTVLYSADAGDDDPGYGTTTTSSISNAIVNYLVFTRESQNSVFDYRPSVIGIDRSSTEPFELNEKTYTFTHTGNVALTGTGENLLCLYTDEGWTALEIYQDYALGKSITSDETNYDNIEGKNLTTLFSNSTFVLYTNEIRANLTLTKTEEDGVTPLEGAKFVFYNTEPVDTTENGEEIYSFYSVSNNGTISWVQMTMSAYNALLESSDYSSGIFQTSNSNGKIVYQNLPDGTYSLIEVEAPEGYEKILPQTVYVSPNLTITNYDVQNITEATDHVDYNANTSNYQFVATIQDIASNDVTIYKKDSETGSLLNGAEFIVSLVDQKDNVRYYYVYDKESDTVTWSSNKDAATVLSTTETDSNGRGEIVLHNVVAGEYTLTEVKSPSGYYLDSSEKKVTVTIEKNDEGQYVLSSSISGDNTANEEDGKMVVYNEPYRIGEFGGVGTWMIILAAVILIVAGVLLRKKKNDDQNQEDV